MACDIDGDALAKAGLLPGMVPGAMLRDTGLGDWAKLGAA